MSTVIDDKTLRKAWLKRKFSSYEYHEELLKLHQQWYELIKQALARPEVEHDYPEDYKFFHEVAFKNFDRVAKPGQWTREFYQARRVGGAYRAIADYGEIMYPNYWRWMTDAEREATEAIWVRMLQMCENIRNTVDRLWFDEDEGNDDDILNDRYTGPIDWPPNWRDDVSDVQVAASDQQDTPQRVPGGQPCPQSGWWFTPAKTGSRRYFKQGEEFPGFEGSDYGETLWQWAPDPSDSRLRVAMRRYGALLVLVVVVITLTPVLGWWRAIIAGFATLAVWAVLVTTVVLIRKRARTPESGGDS